MEAMFSYSLWQLKTVLEVEDDVKLTGAKDKSRIIRPPADVNIKIGTKVGFFNQA